MGREVITIQAGGFANYVGAHYWNFQDELLGLASNPQEGYLAEQVDPIVVQRQHEDRQGNLTYTPRAVIFDLNGSLGGASHSSLTGAQAPEASSSAAESTWRGQVDIHVAERVLRSQFVQKLEQELDLDASDTSAEARAAADALAEAARELSMEGGVKYWTDYLKVYLAPQSLCLLPGLWQGAADFSGFGHGHGVLGSDELRETALDRVRAFAEECDTLQGFQFFAEDLTGFGHFSYELLQLLADEYSRTPVILWALRPTQQATSSSTAATRQRRLSEAASLARLSEVASLYIPLAPPPSIPGVRWKPGNLFQASALCASVIEAASMPCRLSANPPTGPLGLPIGGCDLPSLTQLLRPCQGNNLVAAFAALPCPELPDLHAAQAAQDARQQTRDADTQQPFTRAHTLSWTPLIPSGVEEKLAESVVLRGAGRGCHLLRVQEAAEALDAGLMSEGARCVRHRCVASEGIPIPLAFPDVFQRQCNGQRAAAAAAAKGGNGRSSRSHAQQSGGHSSQARHLSSLPALTRLCATPQAGDVAKAELQDFQVLARSGPGQAILQGWSYTGDDVAEIEERLQHMASCFDADDSADAF